MALIERLKEALGVDGTATVSYSLTVYRCNECRTAFDSSDHVDAVECPDCGTEDVRELVVSPQ